MTDGVCKLCGAPTYSDKRRKNYCGSPKHVGSCAYQYARTASNAWNKKNYDANRKASVSAHKAMNWRKVDGRDVEIAWLNG